MATKKATKSKTTKKTTVKTPKKKTCAAKKNCSENMYFWGGIAIALCAVGAFMILAFGVGQMIR